MATDQLKNKIAKQQTNQAAGSKTRTIRDAIRAMENEIKAALPAVITPERFTRMALSAISNTPKLAECSEKSFLAALMNAAQLGLEPNTPLGQAYLIPYNTKHGMVAQFQIGYKGMIELAHRSGQFSVIYAMEVCENDEFDYEYGYDLFLKHKPAIKDRGKVVFYYAVYRFVNGGGAFLVMSMDDVTRYGKRYSKAFKDGPWQTNFDEMAKKTVIKRLLNHAPIRAEFARGIQQDSTIKYDISDDMTLVEGEIIADDYEIIDDYPEEDEPTPFDN